jgi:hypothetical protein
MNYQIDEIASPVEQAVEPVEGSQKRQVRGHPLRPNRGQADGRVRIAHQENRRQMIANDGERSFDRLLRLSFALVSPPYLFDSFPGLN